MERDAGVVRGEIWWAATPGGDRPVLVMTRDPVADRLSAVVIVPCTRTVRGLTSELVLGPEDGMPTACVANFDTMHSVRRELLRRRITRLSGSKLDEACEVLARALGCR